MKRTWRIGLLIASFALLSIPLGLYAQEQYALFVFAADQNGVPVLDLKPTDLRITEEAGPVNVVEMRRFGWPMKITVLVDNGPRTTESLVHYRSGLKKFFDGLPSDVPVTLIATAPNPRWLQRETKDRVQIARAINLIAPDQSLGRFSDALIEYAARLDLEFKQMEGNQLPPYQPVLVALSTTQQDGSEVVREKNLKMITSLRKHRVWTHMIMVSGTRTPTEPGGLPNVQTDEGQVAQIAKIVQEATNGTYTPVTEAGTSGLTTAVLPQLAQTISARYIRSMTQHRIVLQRAPGAEGPMKKFSLGLVNRPGVSVLVSTNGVVP
jgi:hypothetical protein